MCWPRGTITSGAAAGVRGSGLFRTPNNFPGNCFDVGDGPSAALTRSDNTGHSVTVVSEEGRGRNRLKPQF